MENIDWKEKIAHLKNAAEINPIDPKPWLAYAAFLEEECDSPGELISVLEKIQILLPSKDFRIRIGDAYVSAGKYDEGIKRISDFLKDKPDPAGYCVLSEALRMAGRPDDAIRACEDTLSIDANYEEAFFLLGELTRKIDRETAIQYYKKAIDIDPGYQLAYSSLGRELIASPSTLDDGIRSLEKAVSLDEDDGWATLYLANSFWRKGDVVEAERMYLRSLDIFSDSKEVRTWFANFLESQGRRSEAERYRNP